jgi:glycosyltransferase involved in cell wall biosynthesis
LGIGEFLTKITHLIPIKNGSKYIASISKQIENNSQIDDEIIVINDGSTDDTQDLLNKWGLNNPQVKILVTEGIGLVEALNLGVKESTGEWIARYDADDEYTNDRISHQLNSIGKNTVAIFSDYDIYLGGKKYAGTIFSPVTPLLTKMSLFASQQTPHPIAFLKKEAVIHVGMYKKEDYPAEDLSLWLRLAKVGDLITVPESLLRYNLNSNGISLQNQVEMKRKKKFVLEKYSNGLIGQHEIDLNLLKEWREIDRYNFGIPRKILAFRNIIISSRAMKLSVTWQNFFAISLELVRPKVLIQLLIILKYRRIRRNARVTQSI